MVNRADVQRLVFSGYKSKPASCVLLLEFGQEEGRAWLGRILTRVTSADSATDPEMISYNLAFTAAGLCRLGLDEASLAGFSSEFLQGMAHPERARALGDLGEDAPENWEFGAGERPVHAILFLYAAALPKLRAELERLRQSFDRFEIQSREIATFLPADGREHFGFCMGMSEPGLTRRDRRRGREPIALGEFLLGHRNAFGERSVGPSVPVLRSTRELPPYTDDPRRLDFGLNGSYLVLRKLQQDVPSFWNHAQATAKLTSTDQTLTAAARWIGRWPNGASLLLHPDEPSLGARATEHPFDYRELDALGARCPLGSHVRRAHPRDELGPGRRRHRLLRRGRLYGPRLDFPASGAITTPEDAQERGLMFLALNADLARQFETVQGSFLNGCGFGPAGERDVLAGRDPRFPRFVGVRGGLYAFLPSLSALNYLSDLGNPRIL